MHENMLLLYLILFTLATVSPLLNNELVMFSRQYCQTLLRFRRTRFFFY